MSLKTKVKVGNITNLSDARYCAGMGVDMLGFKINGTDGKAISSTKFKEISNWVSGPEFVLELSEFPADQKEINEIGFIELTASEFKGLTSLKFQGRIIIVISSKEWPFYQNDLIAQKHKIAYLLVNNPSYLEITVLKSYVEEMSSDFAVLLGIDAPDNSVDEYLKWPIAGIALNGSEEISPGIKDYDHLSSILERLEVE